MTGSASRLPYKLLTAYKPGNQTYDLIILTEIVQTKMILKLYIFILLAVHKGVFREMCDHMTRGNNLASGVRGGFLQLR